MLVLFISLLMGACGSADEPETGEESIEESIEDERPEFRIVLAGAATDTLSGNALFGHVINPRTRGEQFVIKLETGIDYVGGLFIARGDTAMPDTRTYPLANVAEAPDSVFATAFIVVYQEGLLRQLKSREGTVTFSHVSDTLISGTLDATLRGHVGTGRGGELRPGEIHLTGRFDARSGIVGFIVGI